MGKKLKENILVLLIVGLFTLLGFALMIDVFVADTIRTEIIEASPVRSSSYEVEEHLSKDDPDYDVTRNTTKTVHETKYYRTVTVEIDGKPTELELNSEFKFLLPGQGRKITLRPDFDDTYFWDHPLRYFLLGLVLSLGGLTIIFFTLHSPAGETKKTKNKQKKRK